MQQTRRQFAATAISALALAGLPARAAPAGPVRQSLAAFSADPGKAAALRRGVAAMKALPGSDHRSWFFQAAVHAYSDALFEAELKRDPKLKSVDGAKYWNKCPHFGQCSADFVIWHRAYLHFFERNLRAAAGDPSLALPYWNYGDPEQRTFPAIYAPEFVDAEKTIANPLFHPNREMSFARGLLELSAAIGEAPKTVGADTFFHVAGRPGFGGDVLDSNHTQIGLLEQRPHNDIHLAVGGVINSANGAMAEITTAAFDPVFWVHHANIDRMWAAWANTTGKSWGPAPSPDWFDAKPWAFVDADGSEVTLSRRDAIALLAGYDVDYPSQLEVPSPPPPPPPPSDEAKPGGGAIGGAAPPAMAPMATAPAFRVGARRPPPERELFADRHPLVVTPRSGARRAFGATSPRHARAENGASPSLSAPELMNPQATVLLELSGIVFKLVPSSGFAVYLDSAGLPPSNDPVGLIDIFGATHHMEGMPGMAAQRFDVTTILRRSSGPFTLRVEPYDLFASRAGAAPRVRTDAVTIGAVRFVVTG